MYTIIALCLCLAVMSECGPVREKRSKYYPYPPPGAVKYYRRPPPPSYPIKGPFSYTPPPSHEPYSHVSRQPEYEGPPTPNRLVRKPEGLADVDFENLVRYLSRNDLDKIVQFAVDQDRRRPPADDLDHREFFKHRPSDDDILSEKPRDHYRTDTPYQSAKYKPDSVDPYEDAERQKPTYDDEPMFKRPSHPNNEDYDRPDSDKSLDEEESRVSFKRILNQRDGLPAPANLRDGLQAAASDQTLDTYKVQGSGDLPLMDYHHSKQFGVDSYKVPHYYITSPARAPTPAQTAAAAHAHSDAHLRAVQVWSHRSQGKAYTLHDDGTLSVERPLRPNYGPPH